MTLDATPLFRGYARWRLGRLDRQAAGPAQARQLQALIRRGRHTRFGKAHRFDRIRSIRDYQAAVPLREYDAFWKDYWQPAFPVLEDVTWPGRVPYFALTSGTTTGTTKYIPLTRAMLRSNARAGLDLLVHHLRNRPKSRMMGGKSLMLGGSTDLQRLAPGVAAGDLSGIAAAELPVWIRPWVFPPRQTALIADWERKIRVLAAAARTTDIRMIAGVPSWLNLFFFQAAGNAPSATFRFADVFPNLELLVHGGVNFEPYRHQFEAYRFGSRAELREVYPASEGFIAVADRKPEDGLRLVLDHGIFYEFVPVEELDTAQPARHWIGTAEIGVNYAVVVSTCAGLWSYVLGDTVRLIDREPPRVRVTGRTAYSLSAFGEHLIEAEIEAAIAHAADRIGREVLDFSVGAIVPKRLGTPGHHLYLVELAGPAPEPETHRVFVASLDRRLSALNEDYDAHRAAGFGLGRPQVRFVREGTFNAWMKSRGRLGGQHKVPRIITDAALWDHLCRFAPSR